MNIPDYLPVLPEYPLPQVDSVAEAMVWAAVGYDPEEAAVRHSAQLLECNGKLVPLIHDLAPYTRETPEAEDITIATAGLTYALFATAAGSKPLPLVSEQTRQAMLDDLTDKTPEEFTRDMRRRIEDYNANLSPAVISMLKYSMPHEQRLSPEEQKLAYNVVLFGHEALRKQAETDAFKAAL